MNLDKPYSMLVGVDNIGGLSLTAVFIKQSPFYLENWMVGKNDGDSIMYDGLFMCVPFTDWKGDYQCLANIVAQHGTSNVPVLIYAGHDKIFLEWRPQYGADTKLLRILRRAGVDFHELRFPPYSGGFFDVYVNEPLGSEEFVDKKMSLLDIQKEAESKPLERCIFKLPLDYMQFERCFGCILDRNDGKYLSNSVREMGGHLEVEHSERWFFYGYPAPNAAPDFKKPFVEGKFSANTPSVFRVTFAGTWESVLHILENYCQHTNS